MKLTAAYLPYISVVVGMYLFRSAWAAILLYHLGILLYLLICRPDHPWRILWGGMRNRLLIPSIAIGAMASPVIYFMWPLFRASDGILVKWMVAYGLTGAAWILMVPYFSTVHPILEEIYWRTISPERVKGFCRQDALFAGYHVLVLCQLVAWPWLIFIFCVLVGSSLFWRWAAERYGGYGLPILSHAAADAGVAAGVWFLLKG